MRKELGVRYAGLKGRGQGGVLREGAASLFPSSWVVWGRLCAAQ